MPVQNNFIRSICCLSLLSILISCENARAADNSDSCTVNRKMLHGILAVEGITAAASLSGLGILWYADYPMSGFHFFNDNREWLQLDKVSHAFGSFNINRIGYDLMRLPGLEKKKAVLYSTAFGFAYMTGIEILDGFSSNWGFSPGDLAANTIGFSAFILQQLAWDEQRILLKWSYHNTKYAQYRPDLLGRNPTERFFKDYNGQTYWLSVNISSFLRQDNKFPKWLNVAFGYSADGMTGAFENPSETNGHPIPYFERTRQYLFSLDLDLTRIKTRSKLLNIIFDVVGVVKFPFPAIEYNSGSGWVFHKLYF